MLDTQLVDPLQQCGVVVRHAVSKLNLVIVILEDEIEGKSVVSVCAALTTAYSLSSSAR